MILLTTLRGDRFGLNPDLVEELRANGANCVVTMITGRSFTAAEDIDTVHEILHDHRVGLLRAASHPPGESRERPGRPEHSRHHPDHPDYLTPVPDKEH
ncbi:flagellar FlbD family protein [Citricoccus sp.]|uniref:flagellar FlbD family protein n=1 Tax=Citricoccus sp. TaxID=1978372 RepID=UPI0028BEA683|nr:flagellar FlbD family protein [Citricoccus sp.]